MGYKTMDRKFLVMEGDQVVSPMFSSMDERDGSWYAAEWCRNNIKPGQLLKIVEISTAAEVKVHPKRGIEFDW